MEASAAAREMAGLAVDQPLVGQRVSSAGGVTVVPPKSSAVEEMHSATNKQVR